MNGNSLQLNGTGKQKCSIPKCNYKSVPGLVSGHGKCPYHWTLGVWGKEWADKCYPDFAENNNKENVMKTDINKILIKCIKAGEINGEDLLSFMGIKSKVEISPADYSTCAFR